MELSPQQIQSILKRFPKINASYETILHKNHPPNSNYNVGLAIPFGKKYYIWYSFYEDKNVCFLMELNRDRNIIRISIKNTNVPHNLALGTLLYVSEMIDFEKREKYFIEDIYYYKGLPLYALLYGEKLGYIQDLFQTGNRCLPLYLPEIWWISADTVAKPVSKLLYPVHHIQFRCLLVNAPYLNQSKNIVDDKPIIQSNIPIVPEIQPPHKFRANYKMHQYRMPTVFIVKADIRFDIYHLYACGKKMANEYYDVACIPSLASSVFMNSLFRNIRENRNLDWIEESDDEEDFENTKEDKYVDTHKKLCMECVFHPKFKKWIPMKVASKFKRIVHINTL